MIALDIAVESYPVAGRFVIARGAKTQAQVVTVTLTAGAARGRGECVPYGRYGETIESVVAQIETIRPVLSSCTGDYGRVAAALPPGAARNAVDCALWDLEAKATGVPAFVRAGLQKMAAVTTAFTISVDSPAAMAEAALRAGARPLLKLKLAGEGDGDRLRSVRAAVPAAQLIVDANEAWQPANLERMIAVCAEARVALIEQPLPAGGDALLAKIERLVPVCADESIHDRTGLAALRERYDAINIKLDKTGGLTEALALAGAARALGFDLMAGCMVATSLAMAPAMLLAPGVTFVDLDGPLLLARDRPDGLRYEGSIVHPPEAALWG